MRGNLLTLFVAQLPASVRAALPASVKAARGPLEMKRALETWLKEQMHTQVTQMSHLKRTAAEYSIPEYIAVVREYLVKTLGAVFPTLKQAADALKSVAALKQLQSLSPAEAHERIVELAALGYPAAIEQFLPASVGPLPSLDSLKQNHTTLAREMMRQLNAAELPKVLREEMHSAFAAAVREVQKLKVLLHELGTPEGVLDTGAERVKEMLLEVMESYPSLLATLASHASFVIPSHLLDIDQLRTVDAKEVKEQVLMKLMPVLTAGRTLLERIPVELMQGKLHEVLEMASRFTAMVEGGQSHARQFLNTAAAAPLRAAVGFLSEDPEQALGDMNASELLVLFYHLLLQKLQVGDPMGHRPTSTRVSGRLLLLSSASPRQQLHSLALSTSLRLRVSRTRLVLADRPGDPRCHTCQAASYTILLSSFLTWSHAAHVLGWAAGGGCADAAHGEGDGRHGQGGVRGRHDPRHARGAGQPQRRAAAAAHQPGGAEAGGAGAGAAAASGVACTGPAAGHQAVRRASHAAGPCRADAHGGGVTREPGGAAGARGDDRRARGGGAAAAAGDRGRGLRRAAAGADSFAARTRRRGS